MNDKFDDKVEGTLTTSCIQKAIDTNNGNYTLKIWDTAGQERFRSINTIFYQDAYICLLVYDITSKQSFEDIKSYWYNSVKENGNEGIIFHIAGNKIDLFEEEEIDKNEIKEYCNNIDAEYNFISALENSFIDDIILQRDEEIIQLKEEIEKLKASKNVFYY